MGWGRQILWLTGLMSIATVARAQEPVSIAVMEFASKGGVQQRQVDALSDMLCNEIRSLGSFKVIGKEDIRSMLTLEEERQRLGSCTDQSCLAEMGGALGVRWVVVGNVSRFGETFLLNLKIIDVRRVQVAGGVSQTIAGGEEQLLVAVPGAARELIAKVADRLEVTPIEEKQEDDESPIQEPHAGDEDAGFTWLVPPADRKGRVIFFVMGGAQLFFFTELTGGPEEQQIFQFLSDSNSTGGASAGLGYGLTHWLSLRARLAGFRLFTKKQEHSGQAFEIIVGLEAHWPTDFWVEPVAYLGAGVSLLSGRTEGEDFDSKGPVIDFGTGADLHLTDRWFLGIRLGGVMRRFGSFAWGDYDKQVSATAFCFAGLLTTGVTL
ncbi:hypothetical protein ACFL6C_07930 [Myxococcota bacterium]